MRSIVFTWAKRYYYGGLGLPMPVKLLYEDSVYEQAFFELLETPIKTILGRDEINERDISDFLQAYQRTQIRSPFYMLKDVAAAYQPGGDVFEGLRAAVEAVTGHLEPAIGMVPHGANIPIYVDEKNNVYGSFPRKVHYVCRMYMTGSTRDIANELLAKNPMNLTEDDIDAMKLISRITKDYAAQLRTANVEVRQGSYFIQSTVSPLDKNFPMYEIRQLMQMMPKNTEYSSQHMQIWKFLERSSTSQAEYPKAYEYLSKLFQNEEAEVVAEPTVSQYPANQTAMVIPDDNVSFDGLGDLLEYYIKDGVILPYWTVKDVIQYFATEEAPKPEVFNPDMRALDATQARLALPILRTLKKFLPEGVELEHALNVISKGGEIPKAPTAAEAFNSVVNKYHIDLAKVVSSPPPAKLAMNLIDSGMDGNLTLDEIAQGVQQHIAPTYQSIDELKEAGLLSPQLQDELAPKPVDPQAVALELITNDYSRDLTLGDLARGQKIPKKPTLKDLVKECGYDNRLTIEDIIEGRDKPLIYNSIAELEAAGVLSKDFVIPQSAPTTDFGYAAAEAILSGIREGIVSRRNETFQEKNAYRTKLVPIYYSFIRLLAFDADKVDEALEYLENLRAKVDDEVKCYIDSAISKIQEVAK